MKRLFFSAGIVLTITFCSCAQHDTKTPDSAGTVPVNQPGAGVDTANRGLSDSTNSVTNMKDTSKGQQ